MIAHTGTHSINTERLILRRFIFEDIPHMLKNWISDPNVQKAYGEPVYTTPIEVEELLNKWIIQYDDPVI